MTSFNLILKDTLVFMIVYQAICLLSGLVSLNDLYQTEPDFEKADGVTIVG